MDEAALLLQLTSDGNAKLHARRVEGHNFGIQQLTERLVGRNLAGDFKRWGHGSCENQVFDEGTTGDVAGAGLG